MKKYILIILVILNISSYSYCDYEFVYTIKEGDTLWDIAIKELHINPLDFSNFAEEVKQANPWIKDDNVIYSNKKLRLTKEVDVRYAASDNIKTDAIIDAPDTNDRKAVSYIVQRGDSLWSILVNKYNITSPVKLKKIINICLEMNPSIRNQNILWIGKKILLPEDTQFVKIDAVIPSEKIESEPFQDILNEAEGKSPSEVDKLLSKVKDYQLVENSLIVICFGRYELKIKADRLLIPQNETSENKQEYLINYISSPSKRTSKHLKNLLKEKSYILIEIIVK